MTFTEVEREYAALKQQFTAGTLTEDQFRARLEELMIEDDQGRWWIVGYETGKWYYHDGEQWVRGDPPASAAASLPPGAVEAARPAPVAQPIEPKPAPAAPAAGGGSAAPPPAAGAPTRGRRGGRFGVIGLLAVVILIAAIAFVALTRQNSTGRVPAATQAAAVAAATTPAPVDTETVAARAEVSVTPPPASPTRAQPSPTEPPPTQTEPPPTRTEAPPTRTEAPPTETATPEPPSPTPTAAPTDTPVPPPPTLRPTATRLRPTAPPANPNVVADFETFGAWKVGNQRNGTLKPVTDPVHDGRYAAQLDYGIPAGRDSFVVFNASPPRAIAGKPTQLSMWVYGDGSGNTLSVWIVDSQGEVQSFPFGAINHTGWQQMTAPLDITNAWPQARVSRAGNDRLDYPIRLAAIVLDGVPDDRSSKGTIVLDSLTVGGPGQ